MPKNLILTLNDEQRMLLFRQTGRHVARLKVDAQSQGIIIDRSCNLCLLHEGLPGVQIESNGLCSQCNRFRLEDNTGAYSAERAMGLVNELRGNGEIDSIVAYSGGKDSAAALLIALERFNLRPLAVLVDNGFVPDRVKESAAEFCTKQGIQLSVRQININALTTKLRERGFRELPCPSCIRMIFQQVHEVARQHDTRLVIGGHRFPPISFAVPNIVGSDDVVCVSPLLALRISEADQLATIGAAGWKDPKIAGNTSNCALIGVMEQFHFDDQGYNPHIYEVSKEIRAGFYSREVGMEKILRPIVSDAQRKFVFDRLQAG